MCGDIGEHVTRVWIATLSSESLATVVAKFYDHLCFYDPVEVLNPFRAIDCTVPSEVQVYGMLHFFQGICIPQCLIIRSLARRRRHLGSHGRL